MSPVIAYLSPFDECGVHTFLLGRDVWIRVVYFASIPSEADLEELLSNQHTFFDVYVCDVSVRDQRLDLRKGRKRFYFVGRDGFLFVNQDVVEYKKENDYKFNAWVMPLANELLAWVKVHESIRVFAFQTGFTSILIRHFGARCVENRQPLINELRACRQSIDDLKTKLEPIWTLPRDLLVGEAVTLETSLDVACVQLAGEEEAYKSARKNGEKMIARVQLAGEVGAYKFDRKNGEKMIARVQTLLQEAESEVLNAWICDLEHGAVEEVESPSALSVSRKRECDDDGRSTTATKKRRTARWDGVVRQVLGDCLKGDQSVLSVGA